MQSSKLPPSTGLLCRTKGQRVVIFFFFLCRNTFYHRGWNRKRWFMGNLRNNTSQARQLLQWPGRWTEIGLLTKCKGVCLGLTNSISQAIPGGHFNNSPWQGTLAKQNAISSLFFWKRGIVLFCWVFLVQGWSVISGMRQERENKECCPRYFVKAEGSDEFRTLFVRARSPRRRMYLRMTLARDVRP